MVKRYLSSVSLDDAIAKMLSVFAINPSNPPYSTKYLPLIDCLGYVAAEPVYAGYSVPPANVSAMDGFAVKSAETIGANEQKPVRITHFLRVNTGNFVPSEFDAVIMVEDTWIEEDNSAFSIRKAARPWQNVRPAGEDIRKGSLIIPRGHKIRAYDCGALGTYGIAGLKVRSLKAGLIPTGSELIKIGEIPKPGQVVESNIPMSAVFLKERHVDSTIYPMTPDVPEEIRSAINKAVDENDLVIVSAGSSAGTKDFTASVIEELGELIYHGISIMPGKPMILGKIRGKMIIGLPGYPISAQVVLREVLAPLLDSWGFTAPPYEKADVVLTADMPSNVGFDEFVLLSVAKKSDDSNDSIYLASAQSKGAGVQMASIRSNAYLRIPSALEGYAAGETVSVNLTQNRDYADNSLLVSGIIDQSAGFLSGIMRDEGIILHTFNSGNMGGVIALKKDSCHLALMHHLGADGEYNIGIVKKYLPNTPVRLAAVAGIKYGIAGMKGTGQNIDLKSLSEGDGVKKLRFANLPADSESKILFDMVLKESGIDKSSINGYETVLANEVAAAMAVANGEYDAVFISYAAAMAYGLSFTEMTSARYEIAIRESVYADSRVQKVIAAISSAAFKDELDSRGGYDTSISGEIRLVK